MTFAHSENVFETFQALIKNLSKVDFCARGGTLFEISFRIYENVASNLFKKSGFFENFPILKVVNFLNIELLKNLYNEKVIFVVDQHEVHDDEDVEDLMFLPEMIKKLSQSRFLQKKVNQPFVPDQQIF